MGYTLDTGYTLGAIWVYLGPRWALKKKFSQKNFPITPYDTCKGVLHVGTQLKYEIVIGESVQALKKLVVEKFGEGKKVFLKWHYDDLRKKVFF